VDHHSKPPTFHAESAILPPCVAAIVLAAGAQVKGWFPAQHGGILSSGEKFSLREEESSGEDFRK
jgi:hypothetical protein